MAKHLKRIPRNYKGTKPTGRIIGDLLPKVLKGVKVKKELSLGVAAKEWTKVIGEKFAHMTRVTSFYQGILQINVKNSTLLSLLSTHEKSRLLKALQEKLPSYNIRDLSFKIGN